MTKRLLLHQCLPRVSLHRSTVSWSRRHAERLDFDVLGCSLETRLSPAKCESTEILRRLELCVCELVVLLSKRIDFNRPFVYILPGQRRGCIHGRIKTTCAPGNIIIFYTRM